MMFQTIDQKSNKWSLWLFILVLVALGTSYFLKTPELSKKAETLQAVQTQVVPALKAQVGCERWRVEQTKKLALQPTVVDPKDVPPDWCAKPPPSK